METGTNSRVVLLTGASSGIGEQAARKLDQAGYQLVLAARNEQKLNSLLSELKGEHLVVPTDVTDQTQVENLVKLCLQRFGRLDVLVNNAGMGFFDPFAEAKLEEWHQMIDVNFKGLLNCIYYALPHLRNTPNAQIIQVASVAAHQVFPNSGVYCATKHAVLAVSKSLQLELAQEVRVTTLSPGAVATPFIEKSTNRELVDNLRDYFAEGLDPGHVANQIVYAIEQPSDVTLSEIIIRPKR